MSQSPGPLSVTLVAQFDRLKVALADRYRLERKIGSGGMATVYLAEDLRHGRKVAVKVLEPGLAAALGVERFLREIEIAAKLTHPHILPLHDSGDAGGLLYYVMPFVDGESLRERLRRDKQLSVPEATRILTEVVDALAYAHQQGVVHRDIKPDNIMIAGRHVWVADFGIAKAVSEAVGDQPLTSFGAAIGTPQYMAPEQAAGDPDIDHRADIYAVGVMGYEMLAGRPPFSGTSTQQLLQAQIHETPEPIERLNAALPPPLAGAVMRCLAKDRSERWQSSADLLDVLEGYATPASGSTAAFAAAGAKVRASPRRVLIAVAGVAVLVAAAGGAMIFAARQQAKAHRTEMLAEIHRLADSDQTSAAHLLAMKADAEQPGDPLLAGVWRSFAAQATVDSDPPGARVLWRDYDSVDGPWNELGRTPLKNVWFPRDGFYRLRLELDGYRPYQGAANYWMLSAGAKFPLDRVGTTSDSMVHVPGISKNTVLDEGGIADYHLDRTEVTNRRYQAFVDAGGYQRQEFWHHPFEEKGVRLTFEQAMGRFKDRTDRPGPSTWELSHFPRGQEEFPVSGLSWYEAAAYAAFEGRELPTVAHWTRAAGILGARWITPVSNFSEKGPAPAGTYRGMTRFGNLDMAGNVREWCFNLQTGAGAGVSRFILGGGWNDPAYSFVDAYAQSPWDRSPTNGVRLMTDHGTRDALEKLQRPIPREFRDYSAEKPVSDAEFNIFLRMYAYDRKPLNAVIERTEVTEDWTRQKVSFDAGYGNERMIAYVFLPKKGKAPFQTVIYYPGSNAMFSSSIDQDPSGWDFIIRTGRIFVYPIYRGTFERHTDLKSDDPDGTVGYRDAVIQWARDLSRTVDYLQTRSDVDAERIGYFGWSWGGQIGGLMLAVEPRLKAAVLHVAGLTFARPLPEADPLNFIPRVKVPVLMLNGRLDHFFPVESSQVPMFQLFGTPPDQKRQIIYDAGHLVPRSQLIKETLDWYDRYLGPVNAARTPVPSN